MVSLVIMLSCLYDICYSFRTLVAICTSLGFSDEELPFLAMCCFFNIFWLFFIWDDLSVLIIIEKKRGKILMMPSRVAIKNLSEHF